MPVSPVRVARAEAHSLPERAPAIHLRPPRTHIRAGWRPREDSNLRTGIRNPLLYPLSYGGAMGSSPPVADEAGLDRAAGTPAVAAIEA